MNKDVARTVHAQQAMEITDLFSYKFGALRFGHKTARRLKLQEPDGPSTAGGVQARQSLVLQTDGDAPQVLVFGWVDTAQRAAEVKSLVALQSLHRQRFQSDLDLEPDEHQRLVNELRGFLRIQKIDLMEVAATPMPAARPRATPPPPKPTAATGGLDVPTLGAVFFAGIAVGLLVGYLVFGQ